MSKVSEDKRFSAASAATLGQLEGLDERFGAMTSAADAIEALLDAGSVPAARLVEAKHELAQLNGDLEKFQFTKIDAVETSELNSGKTDAKAHRKVVRPHPHLLPSPPPPRAFSPQSRPSYRAPSRGAARPQALNQDVEATQRLITELGERVREAEAQADDGTPSAQVPVARETISAALQKVAALRRDGRLDGDQAAATKDLVIRGDARVLAVCATDDDDACVEGLLALI